MNTIIVLVSMILCISLINVIIKPQKGALCQKKYSMIAWMRIKR